jgi:hypothetical protein
VNCTIFAVRSKKTGLVLSKTNWFSPRIAQLLLENNYWKIWLEYYGPYLCTPVPKTGGR